MEMEDLENSLFCITGCSFKFYNGKKETENHKCEMCNQIITDSELLLVDGRYYHQQHFTCSICNIDLNKDEQTAFFR